MPEHPQQPDRMTAPISAVREGDGDTLTAMEELSRPPVMPAADSVQRSPAWLIWDNRGFLGRFVFWTMLVLAIVVAAWPNRYESSTRIVPPDTNSGSSMLAAMAASTMRGAGLPLGGLGSLAGDLLGGKNQGAYFISILRSRTVQDRMIERFHLQKVYRHRYMKDARKDLTKYTSIEEDRKSNGLTITVTDRNRRRARDMANAYVDELNRVSATLNTSAAHRERVFLENRLQEVRKDMDVAAKEFSEYASKNATLDIKEQGKAMVEAAAVLQGQYITAKSELQGLEQIYTDNNVRVRTLKGRIAELERQMQKIGGTGAGSSTAASEQELYPPLRKLPLLGVRWADLYRTVRIQETVFELLTEQYELAKIQEAKELPIVRVLDTGDLPEKKSSPQRLLILLAGLVASLAIGSVFILSREYWNQIDPTSDRKALALEVGRWVKSMYRNRPARLKWNRNGRPDYPSGSY